MVDITETAVQKAKEVLTTEGKSEWGLKIFTAGGGCCGPSFGMDILEQPESGDQVVEKDGLKVFANDETIESLKGLTVDYIETDQQAGFVIRQSEAGGGCACSSSSCC